MISINNSDIQVDHDSYIIGLIFNVFDMLIMVSIRSSRCENFDV
jgi:hypothetical protein